MVSLCEITENDISSLDGTSYESMNVKEKERMILESRIHYHNGNYFKLFKIMNDETEVGVLSVYAHSEHIAGIAPEIKQEYRKNGFAFKAMCLAEEFALNQGITIVSNSVKDTNQGSIALHKKAGYELDRMYKNTTGDVILMFIKNLLR